MVASGGSQVAATPAAPAEAVAPAAPVTPAVPVTPVAPVEQVAGAVFVVARRGRNESLFRNYDDSDDAGAAGTWDARV